MFKALDYYAKEHGSIPDYRMLLLLSSLNINIPIQRFELTFSKSPWQIFEDFLNYSRAAKIGRKGTIKMCACGGRGRGRGEEQEIFAATTPNKVTSKIF